MRFHRHKSNRNRLLIWEQNDTELRNECNESIAYYYI